MYFTQFGQAILSPDKDQIWAYWAQNKNIPHPQMKFMTTSQLVNTSPFPDEPDPNPIRDLSVNWDGTVWYAGGQCVQQDFAENKMFLMSAMTGPQTVDNAMDILLNDPEFRRFFEKSAPPNYQDGMLQRLEQFHSFVKRDYRKNTMFT